MKRYPDNRYPLAALAIALMLAGEALAGPLVPAGDTLLRHDLQVLADHGILQGPMTTWPLAWGPILSQIDDVDPARVLPAAVALSLNRIRSRAQWDTRTNELTFSASVSAAASPARIRSFENTPRESAEAGGGVAWTGERFSFDVQGQLVDQSNGSGEARADNTFIGVALGNWSLSANTLDRWWGPGRDGSLILSNNARPIPAVSLDRNFTDPFETNWLSWIGPWDVSVMMGQLESDREVPDALFFGLRFNFRPIPSLEIGLSRTAQWCGDSRPCDAGTFADLLLGQDNIGDAGINADNEPGNQLAGADVRWSPAFFDLPVAGYAQLIGEDEAGGFPSRYIGQFGVEASGLWSDAWSWRWFGEFAATTCQFYESSELFNCAYNHGIYRTGYRFRDRSIGHGADNDAQVVSTGITLINSEQTQWRALLRFGELNRGPGPDARNTLTALPQDIASIDIEHSRAIRYGVIDAGIGFEQLDSNSSGSDDDLRFHLRWRSSY